jgi:hypothetical protein
MFRGGSGAGAGAGAASLVGGGGGRRRTGAEEALQLVEADADNRDGPRLSNLLIRRLEEALPAHGRRRRRLPGRGRARGGLPQVADPAARRRPAAVVVAGEHERERRLRGAGRREGRRFRGPVQLRGRRHAVILTPKPDPGGFKFNRSTVIAVYRAGEARGGELSRRARC